MQTVSERIDPERAWIGAAVALVAALIGGALAFPRQVYDGFIWRYFWGPVVADARGARCAVRAGGEVTYHTSADLCAAATGVVARPGYTLVSEVGYAVTLIFALAGVVFLLRRLDIGRDRGFFYALVPFMFFGGALRVVEDANDAVVPANSLVSYPANTLIISPVIYFTVFFVTLAAVLAAVALDRNGVVDGYERPLFGVGVAVLALTLGYLGFLSATTTEVGFYPQITVIVLVGATLSAAAVWYGVERFAPELNRGTGLIGLVILWGHAVDGVANVVGIDWARELGLRGDLIPKHPVNRAVIDITGSVLPESVIHYTGSAWPFLLVKLAAALFVVWVFDDAIYEESPRYTILLLVAILAVGLGPGTRDMLRATFGI